MLTFLLSGCSFRAIRHAKLAILGEFIMFAGFLIGFLGWTEWIDPKGAMEELGGPASQYNTDFIIFGFMTILFGLAIYLLDGLLRSLRHSKRTNTTSRIPDPVAETSSALPTVRPTRIRVRTVWRSRAMGTS